MRDQIITSKEVIIRNIDLELTGERENKDSSTTENETFETFREQCETNDFNARST